jgi:hypothetical protein
MDPQKLSQLDPKLRDVYQRVMGTSIPMSQATPVNTQNSTQFAPNFPQQQAQQMQQEMPQPISIPKPIQPQFIPAQQPIPTQRPPVINPTQMNPGMQAPAAPMPTATQNPSPVPQAQAVVLRKKNSVIIPILFGLVGIIFIVIYTLFWTKVFNLKLPFLP